jgi:hypothetical protein
MKKIFFLILQVATLNIWSQTNHDIMPLNSSLQNFDVVILNDNNPYRAGFRNDINVNAIRDFARSFENATDILWRISEKDISVSFSWNNESITSYYDRKGNHLSTRKTYTENQLDPLIADQIKKELGKDFSIYLVTEVIKRDNTIYEISLESCRYWCIVKLIKKKSGLEKLSENILLLKG